MRAACLHHANRNMVIRFVTVLAFLTVTSCSTSHLHHDFLTNLEIIWNAWIPHAYLSSMIRGHPSLRWHRQLSTTSIFAQITVSCRLQRLQKGFELQHKTQEKEPQIRQGSWPRMLRQPTRLQRRRHSVMQRLRIRLPRRLRLGLQAKQRLLIRQPSKRLKVLQKLQIRLPKTLLQSWQGKLRLQIELPRIKLLVMPKLLTRQQSKKLKVLQKLQIRPPRNKLPSWPKELKMQIRLLRLQSVMPSQLW
jgi:hypothetical protein